MLNWYRFFRILKVLRNIYPHIIFFNQFYRFLANLFNIKSSFLIVVSLLLKQFQFSNVWGNLDFGLYCLALIATIFSLIMYVKDLYSKGFIDKKDLKKDVVVDKKDNKK